MSSPHAMIHQSAHRKLGSPWQRTHSAYRAHSPRLKASTSHGRISTHAIHAARRPECGARRQQCHTHATGKSYYHCLRRQQAAQLLQGVSHTSARNPTVPRSQPPLPHPPSPHAPYRTRGGKGGQPTNSHLPPPMSSLARGTNTWFGPARSTGLPMAV